MNEDNKTVCIIGAGLGGLFTGAILAREGLKVTVLEKNVTIGGGLQSFTRFGEVFDTGMHVIGGMQEGGNVRRICEYLGVWDERLISYVNPERADRIYVAEDDAYYDIKQGREGFVESLSKYFPDQHDNLVRYVEAVGRIAGELPLFALKTSSAGLAMHSDEFFMAADAFIEKYITDARLRSVVAYMNPLYAGRAAMTPAFVHCILSVLCMNGQSRFAGGSDLFANKLRDKIIECGGQVLAHECVTAIHTEGKTITGVTTSKGNTYTADYYVSDIHPSTLFDLFDDPSALPKAFRHRVSEIPDSCSAFTLNIKLKPGTFPYLDHTAYYIERYDGLWHFGDADAPWPLGFLYMTPPEIENQGEYTNKMIVTVPMAWEHAKPWEHTTFGHRTPEYEEWKRQCADAVISKLERIYPRIRACIDKVNTASPLTIRDFYGVRNGGMAGYAKDCNNITQSHMSVVTKIPNLLLTGQYINLHGFCGVPLTAILTSEAILGENYVLNKINMAPSNSPIRGGFGVTCQPVG